MKEAFNGMDELAAMTQEARRRGISYGRLAATVSPVEKEAIYRRFREAREAEKRAKPGKGCRGCRYWQKVGCGSEGGLMVCNYLFVTGKRSQKENGICRSRDEGKREVKRTCIIDATEKSVYTGTKQVRGRKKCGG